MSEHGGQLRKAASQYGMPLSDWLDLSTGINPRHYPIPEIPSRCWLHLPELDDGLMSAAYEYYKTQDLLAVSGSQQAIQALPYLRKKSRIGLLATSYYEHKAAWKAAGHEVVLLQPDEVEGSIESLDVLLLVNPNNPTCDVFSGERLEGYLKQLQNRGGWLIVDEAFIDCTSEKSVISFKARDGLIVLRSLGKFFGLAGCRVGFVHAVSSLLERMQQAIGPWPIANPSRYVAQCALQNTEWQQETQQFLHKQSEQLAQILSLIPSSVHRNTALFHWLKNDDANELFVGLAERGILIRQFTEPKSLRFGLPATNQECVRLKKALAEVLNR